MAGSCFGAWGLLIRQFAVLVPLAFLLAAAPVALRLGRRRLVRLFVAFVIPWVLAWCLLQWLPSKAMELGFTWNPRGLGETLPEQVGGGLKFYGLSMVYMALFAFPLLLAAIPYWWRYKEGHWKRRTIGVALVLLLMLVVVCAGEPRRLPYLGNLLHDTGVGPMTLKGILMGAYLWRPVSVGGWWWIPTLLGLFGAAWMVAAVVRWFVLIPGDGRRPVGDPRRRQQCFLLLWATLSVLALYHPWVPVRFDRYLLGALVPVVVMAALVPAMRGPVWRVAQAAGCLLLYGFSVLGLQDYLAWNTTRWAMANRLMADGVPPEEIDAGYEFNGWYTSPHFIARDGASAFFHSGDLYWWAVKDTWAVSWLPRPGFEKVQTVNYGSWLAGDKGELLLLRRKPEE